MQHLKAEIAPQSTDAKKLDISTILYVMAIPLVILIEYELGTGYLVFFSFIFALGVFFSARIDSINTSRNKPTVHSGDGGTFSQSEMFSSENSEVSNIVSDGGSFERAGNS